MASNQFFFLLQNGNNLDDNICYSVTSVVGFTTMILEFQNLSIGKMTIQSKKKYSQTLLGKFLFLLVWSDKRLNYYKMISDKGTPIF